MNNKSILVAALGLVLTAGPAVAQNYHYNYGDSRVVNQNQTGLYTPSSTYIGAGTLSRSAQGKAAGVGGSLPAVNMGSHVRTPGDNIYDGDGSDRASNGAFIYKDQEAAIAARQRAKIVAQQRRAMMMQQQQQRQQQQGYVYVPGSNGTTASYGSMPSAPPMQFRNGAATYGDNFGKAGGSVRNF